MDYDLLQQWKQELSTELHQKLQQQLTTHAQQFSHQQARQKAENSLKWNLYKADKESENGSLSPAWKKKKKNKVNLPPRYHELVGELELRKKTKLSQLRKINLNFLVLTL